MTDISGLFIGLGGVLLGYAIRSPAARLLFLRLRGISSYREGRVKMVLVVRQDVEMSKGKTAAQCSHAAVSCYQLVQMSSPQILHKWLAQGQPKIVLKAEKPGEKNLTELLQKAQSIGVTASIVRDAGRTEVSRGTATVVGIGPGPQSLVDKVTGHLRTA